MSEITHPFSSFISRRRALALGGGLAGGLVAGAFPLRASASPQSAAVTPDTSANKDLPVAQIEKIMQTQGTASNGVFSLEQDRNDLKVTGPGGIPFKAPFEINNGFYFQSLGKGFAALNGDICVLPSETNRAIDHVLASGLTMMAFHQHFFDLSPQVFFMHFRGFGDPLKLAHAAAYVVAATGTPLPQTMPSNPTTPLNPTELGHILGGSATVGSEGVVTVGVTRKEAIYLGGHHVESDLGILTTVAFEPLRNESDCAVAPDFALLGTEVGPVFKTMRGYGFQIHCLYNQETSEQPQFYFSHMLKRGNPYEIARQIRAGLNRTNSSFS